MPDESTTPSADPPPQQAMDGQGTQTPPPSNSEATVTGQASEPVTLPFAEPAPPSQDAATAAEPNTAFCGQKFNGSNLCYGLEKLTAPQEYFPSLVASLKRFTDIHTSP